jgi:hypothetical protein
VSAFSMAIGKYLQGAISFSGREIKDSFESMEGKEFSV